MTTGILAYLLENIGGQIVELVVRAPAVLAVVMTKQKKTEHHLERPWTRSVLKPFREESSVDLP